jgi:hypothetical protein
MNKYMLFFFPILFFTGCGVASDGVPKSSAEEQFIISGITETMLPEQAAAVEATLREQWEQAKNQ